MKKSILLLLIMLSTTLTTTANNIQVSNVSFEGIPGDDSYEITFDLSWENSWRTSTYESNYDAAWVFIKYRGGQYTEWTHALLDGNNGPTPTGAELIFSPDQLGLFIQRSSDGIGDVDFEGFHLAWQLEDFFFPDDEVEICVYAIEMVYIPAGPFQVGDGYDLLGLNGFTRFSSGISGNPFTILSENQLTIGGASTSNLSKIDGQYQQPLDDFDFVTTRTLPNAYPKGYQAFYSMKYEISQGQYAAFLSNLLPVEAADRYDANSYAFQGQSIKLIGFPSRYRAEAPNRAAGHLNWVDIAAYAEWSGLRPMSELEYEKICRGPVEPVQQECAWGNNSIYAEFYLIEGNASSTAIITNPELGIGNAQYNLTDGFDGPTHCGIFSNSIANPSRQEAGASYYGVMEMSGNLYELVISLGTPEGRLFDGSFHGDGTVSANGVPTWPAVDGDPDFIGLGTGYRGGDFRALILELAVSSRAFSNFNLGTLRDSGFGGRLVRSNF